MEPRARSASGVRAGRLLVLAVVAAAVVTMQAGCRHRRNAMRPVFLAPGAAVGAVPVGRLRRCVRAGDAL